VDLADQKIIWLAAQSILVKQEIVRSLRVIRLTVVMRKKSTNISRK
jgi:hypothetical protein